MKYLCQETDTSFITSPKVIMEEEPSMCEPEDSLGGITNLETMELNGGPLPYFLPQVPNFKGSKPPQGTKCYTSFNV
ncbi:hypothetical protein LINPERPRIM_LOCUS13288, partial [Linum perenne]